MVFDKATFPFRTPGSLFGTANMLLDLTSFVEWFSGPPHNDLASSNDQTTPFNGPTCTLMNSHVGNDDVEPHDVAAGPDFNGPSTSN